MRISGKYFKEPPRAVFYPPTQFGRALVCIIFAAALIFFGSWSLLDNDKKVSESENRSLKQKPVFDLISLYNKTYTADFDEYYADAFPLREYFLSVNRKVSSVLAGTKGADDIVLVQKQDKDDFAGQDIDYDE